MNAIMTRHAQARTCAVGRAIISGGFQFGPYFVHSYFIVSVIARLRSQVSTIDDQDVTLTNQPPLLESNEDLLQLLQF